MVHFDEFKMSRAYTETDEDAALVKNVLFDRLYWDRLDEGTISDSEVIRCSCERLPSRLHEACRMAYDNWIGNIPFIDGMPELVKKLRAKTDNIFLLSNISMGFSEKYSEYPEIKALFSNFKGLVFSGVEGVVKPNEQIFRILLDRYSLKAEESIFIDDSQKNIEGAQRLGINTYLFDGDVSALEKHIII